MMFGASLDCILRVKLVFSGFASQLNLCSRGC